MKFSIYLNRRVFCNEDFLTYFNITNIVPVGIRGSDTFHRCSAMFNKKKKKKKKNFSHFLLANLKFPLGWNKKSSSDQSFSPKIYTLVLFNCISDIYKSKHYNISIQMGFKLKKDKEKSRKCHIHKPQPFPDTKRKRKQPKPNKRQSNKRTKGTKISSLFPKRGYRNAKRTENPKNRITQGKA